MWKYIIKGPMTSIKAALILNLSAVGIVVPFLVLVLAIKLFSPPNLPILEMDQYWGSYPIDPNTNTSVQPFKIQFTDEMIKDLKDRLQNTRAQAPPLENAGFTYGFNSKFLKKVVDYWNNEYDFKEREQFLNQYDHFKINIQGLNIHFVRVQPKNVGENVHVVPMLLLHGWPGSVREFYEMIPLLTTPREGYNFVFEVIVPSLPGLGFSEDAHRPCFGVLERAIVLHNLMLKLGFTKYYIQGGDAGHIIGTAMATAFPNYVLGLHTNFPNVLTNPKGILMSIFGTMFPWLLETEELRSRAYPLQKHITWQLRESGYMHIQATKPDTVGVALSDSPAGLAAYILEKFSGWTHRDYIKAADGDLPKKFDLTHLLDNVMLYWTSNCITTSVRMYAETLNRKEIFGKKLDAIPTYVPTWGIKFKHELMYQPDSVLKTKYRNYLHSTIVDDGGHFAAMENPDIMAADVFKAVDAFRSFHGHDKIEEEPQPKTIYDFTVKDIMGKDVKLDKYRGYVVLIVNVASQCGLTDTNYKELNELYEKYAVKGLRILAFPCNQFNGQEPGSAKEILAFTKTRGVLFDIFEKVDVNGENAHPLWKFLKETQSGLMGNFIKWNFSKFIVDRNGIPVERLGPNVNPMQLESYLEKYW